MPDPVLVAIAGALAGKAAGAAVSGGRSALRALIELVRRKFATEKDVLDAIESRERPETAAGTGSEPAAEVLGAALERAAADDPEFADQLRRLWDQAKTELHADHGGVVNEVSGTVSGHVVQARDVTGGISFGDVPRRSG